MNDIDSDLASLSIQGEEEEELAIQVVDPRQGVSFAHCFIGSFLTTSVVNFMSMRTTLANVWNPVGGISVLNLGEKRFLFRLFHKIDIE
ncbi:hypothetical protein HRI_002753100 [Hibiscus trionum]|uniref:DUF4283 domain-containing protein n=1 Tax=Hibiscus trionum TaxID=183268 RepID=A0A9W7I8E9_HIBTR|nr:hypothetical protein HRI_002753100 [Hibiscus trionum]